MYVLIYSFICVSIYLCMYLFIHLFENIFIYLFMYVFIYSFIWEYIYLFIYLFVYVCIYLFIYLCTYLFIYVFVYLFIYVCIYLSCFLATWKCQVYERCVSMQPRYVKWCNAAHYCSKSCLINSSSHFRRNVLDSWRGQELIHRYGGDRWRCMLGTQCQGRFWTVPNKQLWFQHYRDHSESTVSLFQLVY